MTITLYSIYVPILVTLCVFLIAIFYPRVNDSYGSSKFFDIVVAVISSLVVWVIYLAITWKIKNVHLLHIPMKKTGSFLLI